MAARVALIKRVVCHCAMAQACRLRVTANPGGGLVNETLANTLRIELELVEQAHVQLVDALNRGRALL